MKLYNTLSRKVEEFKPLQVHNVGMYACGPTVYDNAHIGHMRKYVGDDLLVRTLKYLGYNVKLVMNITDVGHLVSDADEGEDKMEKGARKHGLSVWDVAEKFTQQFFDSIQALNIPKPDVICKATNYIPEQIELVQRLTAKGFTYATDDGIYFDTSKFPEYGQLSNLQSIKEGARVEKNDQKRNPSDFALWKYSYEGGRSFDEAQDDSSNRRQMEWDSPWGKGFPGWHLECSAMSMKYLGEQFDIHTGGIDHVEIHHPNEIAQSEAATGKKPFVKYWVHHHFLMVDSTKMSKSLGNLYTVQDVVERGIDPLALRYLFLQTHYRKEMNFTWESLEAAGKALGKLRKWVVTTFPLFAKEGTKGSFMGTGSAKTPSTSPFSKEGEVYRQRFTASISDDLNMPQALALVWEVIKDEELVDEEKMALVMDFDKVLGLGLERATSPYRVNNERRATSIPDEIQKLVDKREQLRQDKRFTEADAVRAEIEAQGYLVEDKTDGVGVRREGLV